MAIWVALPVLPPIPGSTDNQNRKSAGQHTPTATSKSRADVKIPPTCRCCYSTAAAVACYPFVHSINTHISG